MEKKPYVVMAHIIEARGLHTEMNSSTKTVDPIASVSVGPISGRTKSTEVKTNTLSAVWEAKFMFEDLMLTDEEFECEKLSFKVEDRNDWKANRLVGSYEFSLSNIQRQNENQYFRTWVPLRLPEDPMKPQGNLLVTVYVLRPTDKTPSVDHVLEEKKILTDPDLPEKKPYVLNVLVYRAQDVLSTHDETANPFVSVRFNGNQLQTDPIFNALHPVWNRKFELPFSQPVTSDSVEIQLWNHRKLRPDKRIGQLTMNYVKEGLMHKDFGPRWVNFYSNNYAPKMVSFWGGVKDSLGASDGAADSEFVGRLLVRMSVSTRDEITMHRKPPRLLQLPANPVADPVGDEYVIDFLLYSSSEIPVLGGHVMVELVFGAKRIQSKWRIGKEGCFHWYEQLELSNFAPVDHTQSHDVVINVYHRVGSSIRKIAFERIKVKELITSDDHYCINGRQLIDELAPWPCKWRSLRSVFPDSNNPHIVSGFLLCSLGMGVKSMRPKKLPKMAPKREEHKYVLRSFIYQAGNLPSGSRQGVSNPMLVLRFAGKEVEFPKKLSTTFPFWNTWSDTPVNISPLHAPDLFIMMYHVTPSSFVTLGRCEVAAKDLSQHKGQIFRFRLYKSENEDPSLNKVKPTDKDPYLLAAFHLFPAHEVPPLPEAWTAGALPPTWTLASLIETVGVRNLNVPDGDKKLVLEYSLPMVEGMKRNQWIPAEGKTVEDDKHKLEEAEESPYPWAHSSVDEAYKREFILSEGGMVEGGSCQFMQAVKFDKILLPRDDPFGFPLRIRLASTEEATDRNEMGVLFEPFLDCLEEKAKEALIKSLKLEPRPDFYENSQHVPDHSDIMSNPTDLHLTIKADAKDKEKTSPTNDDEDPLISDSEDENKDAANAFLDQEQNDVPLKEAKVWGLDLEQGVLNVVVEDRGNELDLLMGEVEDEKDDDKDDKEAPPPPKRTLLPTALHFYQGKQTGFSGTTNALLKINTLETYSRTGTVKLFVTAILLPEDEDESAMLKQKMSDENKRLATLSAEVYREKWITRLYLYSAHNLSARNRFMNGGYQTASPYLIIKNGQGPNHEFNGRVNAIEDTLHPDFHQVFEVFTVIPENALLTIEVWDKNDLAGDDLIGTKSIDIEDRVIDNKAIGNREPFFLVNTSAPGFQGKVWGKIHIMTEDQARKQKAEEVSATHAEEYELRLVVWNSRGVRFPERPNDPVDQRIVVTSNFEAKYGNDTVKQTDVAWYSSPSITEWNNRMLWRVQLPAKVPRLKFQVFDENVMTANEAIGECNYNLKPFFDKCRRAKQPITHEASEWVQFTHPDFPGVLGELNIELWLYTAIEADKNKVGEAQKEPNKDPYLPMPARNPPPWAVGTRGLDYLQRRRNMLMCLCCLLVFLPVVIIPLILSMKGKVV